MSDVPQCECGSDDLELSDHGTSRTGRPWNEYECQECGSVFFDDLVSR